MRATWASKRLKPTPESLPNQLIQMSGISVLLVQAGTLQVLNQARTPQCGTYDSHGFGACHLPLLVLRRVILLVRLRSSTSRAEYVFGQVLSLKLDSKSVGPVADTHIVQLDQGAGLGDEKRVVHNEKALDVVILEQRYYFF